MSEKLGREGPRRWCPRCLTSWPENQPNGIRIRCVICDEACERQAGDGRAPSCRHSMQDHYIDKATGALCCSECDDEVKAKEREAAVSTLAELERFADALDERGILSRRYSKHELAELYVAAKHVHRHLCSLCSEPQHKARGATLQDFANAYAVVAGGVKVFTAADLGESAIVALRDAPAKKLEPELAAVPPSDTVERKCGVPGCERVGRVPRWQSYWCGEHPKDRQ